MSSHNYVDASNVNLLCCICRTPFYEPVTTRTCSHTFCRACISTALSLSKCCPIDRSSLTVEDLSPADPLLRNLVDELEVECPRRSAGCSVTCQRQLVNFHLADSCLFVEVSCEDGLCDAVVLRKDSKHSAHAGSTTTAQSDAERKKELSSCDACGSEFSSSEITSHRAACQDVEVDCAQAANGCEWKGTRQELTSSHLPKCPYEAIKGFFAVHDKKTSALSEENVILRHKISAMDGIIVSLQRELANVEAVLGPWYRREGIPGRRRTSEPSTVTQAISRHSYQGHPAQNASISSVGHIAASPSNAVIVDPTDLSLYFPPPDQDDLPLVHPQTELFNSSEPSPYYSVSTSNTASTRVPVSTHGSYLQPPPVGGNIQLGLSGSPPQSPVAPLDVSSTLEGSLSGLRESIVTVSAALDSLSRRQEVALATESMRTTEDIRSLRAAIHGLRMQVHSIMMDRNAQATGRAGDESLPPMWLPEMREGPPPLPWLHMPYTQRYPHPAMSASTTSIPKL